MKIIEDFIPKGRQNRSGIQMNPTYITIHDTGNSSIGADAKMHASYVKTTDRMVSWHYTVDDQQIYQHLPLSEVGWHAGDSTGEGNMKSIGIEICMNSDGNRPDAEKNAKELVVFLMKKYGIPLNKVVQHNKWSGKDCPQILRNRELGWSMFLKDIDDLYKGEGQQDDPNPNVPQWQIDDFNKFMERGILNSPNYWEDRLHESMTIGEVFALIERVLEKTL